MEDAEAAHPSGPPQATGPQISLDSDMVSILEGKGAGKECLPSESSKLSARTFPIADSSPRVEHHSREASPKGHGNDKLTEIDGAAFAAVDEKDASSGRKDIAAKSPALDGPGVELVSDVSIAGVGAATSTSDQLQVENLQPVDSQERSIEEKERIESGKSPSSGRLKIGEWKGTDDVTDGSGSIKTELQIFREKLAAPSQSTLMAVLEELVSLDPTEVFKDPVDDSFAPKYSKVIKTPMCFSMMQEKIGLHQYPSWSLFVEDFERICNNAMKYNQKRSRVWNAANTLLRQGRKVIEPYAEQAASRMGTTTSPDGDATKFAVQDEAQNPPLDAVKDAVQVGVEDVVQAPGKAVILDVEKNGIQVVADGTAGDLGEDKSITSPQGGVLEREFVPKTNPEIAQVSVGAIPPPADLDLQMSEVGEKGSPVSGDVSKDTMLKLVRVPPNVDSLSKKNHALSHRSKRPLAEPSVETRVKRRNEDVKVEILASTGSEDVRPDSRDEATECSSSFGYTQSKVESDPEADGFLQNAEVDSELRDGNGALSSAGAEDDDSGRGNERGKKALNAEWKKYRRGIEWRCRWLEIRLNELRERSQRYDRLLAERKAKKSWVTNVQPGEESSARCAQLIDSPERGRVLRRVRRQEVENTVDLDKYMARHPLFSRYDNKKKREKEDTSVEAETDALQDIQPQQDLVVELDKSVRDESDTEEQPVAGRLSGVGQDSIEKILWKLEALQARVAKAKSQLQKGAPPKLVAQSLNIPKPPSNLSRVSSLVSPRISGPGTLPRPPGTKGRPPFGQSPGVSGTSPGNGAPQRQSSGVFRRKSSDYDINNMVMPVSVGAKYVEHIKHADISTPMWRLVDNAGAADHSKDKDSAKDGSSSEEDTDDEKFEMRHSEMEINEKKHRYMLPSKRSPDADFSSGKGRSKSGLGKGPGKMSGRGSGKGSVPAKGSTTPAVESPPDSGSSPAFSGSIPKGKRRKRLFNALAFKTNYAQRLNAYLAEPSSSAASPEDTAEPSTLEETSSETPIPPELDKSSLQPLDSGDQADLKRKKPAVSGLQVLANP